MAWSRCNTAGLAPVLLLLAAGLVAACAAPPAGEGLPPAAGPAAAPVAVAGTLLRIASLPALIADARKQMALEAPRSALGYLDTAVRLNAEDASPQRAEVLSLRAEVLLATGQPARALADVDDAIAVKDDIAAYYVLRAAALFSLRRPADAVAALDRAIGLTPDEAPYHLLRAKVLLVIGRTDAALADFGAYGARQGGLHNGFQRAIVQHLQRNYHAAIAEYDNVLTQETGETPGSRTAVTRLMRGFAHHQAGHFDAAARDYGAVLAIRPDWDFVRAPRERARKQIPFGPAVEA